MGDRILIAMDLDETLIHSTSMEQSRPADFCFEDYYVYVRPHLKDFMQKCNGIFNFAIWSAGGKVYVNSIVSKIIPPSVKLDFVWTRPEFADVNMLALDTMSATKNIHRLITNGYKPSNVLIIDDNPDDSVCEFGNVLQVQPFRGEPDDCELLILSRYLEKARFLKDTRDIAHP